MNVEVEIISKEIIKPSSPTPNHLRQYKLSFLDNICPRIYTSLVLFYELKGETQPTISHISKHLKKSLAEVLTLFYPLAGRIKVDNQLIDCNDEGIPFLQALVTNKCRLTDVVNNPVAEELSTLIPFQLTDHVGNEFTLGVQLNIFDCGGFAIGLCTSHKLADGLSMLMFTKTWADIARGLHYHNDNYQTKIECPELVSASLFPPKEFCGRQMDVDITTDIVTKRFAFSASTIEDLQDKYRGSGPDHHKGPPSRVESLSTFIWRRLMEATKDDDQHVDENTLHTMSYSVNLRPKFDPPLPPHSFGNIFYFFMTDFFLSGGVIGDDDDDQETCHGIARQVREEVEKIDKDYVKRLQHGDEHSSFVNRYAESYTRSKKVVMTACSSLCRFPLYENDFGWGRPTWVGVPPLPLKNLIVLVDTKEVGGIEAYVSLADQAVMTKFENDPLLRRRVGMNRIGSANTSLTRQLARFNQVSSFHTRSQPGVMTKKPAHTKPTTLGSPSVLFRLLVKLVRK